MLTNNSLFPSLTKRLMDLRLTTIANLVARIISLCAQFVIIKIMLKYLGEEKYGIWITISSLASILQFGELGLANSLVGYASRARLEGGHSAVYQVLRKGLLASLTLSLVIITFSIFIASTANIPGWFNIKGVQDQSDFYQSLLVFIIIFTFGMPASLGGQVLLGLQKGYIAAGFQSLGSLIGIALVFIAAQYKFNLPLTIACAMGGTFIGQLSALIYVLASVSSVETPQPAYHLSFHSLFSTSAGFFALQICSLVSYQVDIIIVSKLLGGADAASYSICQKVFSVPGLLLSVFFVSAWAAYADAIAVGDKAWIWYVFSKSIIFSAILTTSLSVFFLLVFPKINHFIGGDNLDFPIWLLSGFAFWASLNAIGGNLATLLNGSGFVKQQIVPSILASILNIFLSVIFTYNYGIGGPIWGSIISTILLYLWLYKEAKTIFREALI